MVALEARVKTPSSLSLEEPFLNFPELEKVELESLPSSEVFGAASEDLLNFFNEGERPEDKSNLLQIAAFFNHALKRADRTGVNFFDFIKQAWNFYSWLLILKEKRGYPEPSEFLGSMQDQALLQHLHATLAPLPIREDESFSLNSHAQVSLPVTASLLFIMEKISLFWSQETETVVSSDHPFFKNQLWGCLLETDRELRLGIEYEDKLTPQIDASLWRAFWRLSAENAFVYEKAA